MATFKLRKLCNIFCWCFMQHLSQCVRGICWRRSFCLRHRRMFASLIPSKWRLAALLPCASAYLTTASFSPAVYAWRLEFVLIFVDSRCIRMYNTYSQLYDSNRTTSTFPLLIYCIVFPGTLIAQVSLGFSGLCLCTPCALLSVRHVWTVN